MHRMAILIFQTRKSVLDTFKISLAQAKKISLAYRTELLCKKVMTDLKSVSHPISFLISPETMSVPYILKSGNENKTRGKKG